MTRLQVADAWRGRLHSRVRQPPARPRVPLLWRGERIGSVEPDLFSRAGMAAALVREDGAGWEVQGASLSASLAQVAAVLRDRRLAAAWRDELLPVRGEGGALLGDVERAAVRPLGIATRAVHLAGVDAAGRHWVQRRALTKSNDPGLWDTLVGGMVPAGESVPQTLARESWEEAGLRLDQLTELRHGGELVTARPSSDVGHGYVVEVLDWYTCTVPAGVQPANQDGEVDEFQAIDAAELARRLQADAFTVDAAAILLAAFAPSPPH